MYNPDFVARVHAERREREAAGLPPVAAPVHAPQKASPLHLALPGDIAELVRAIAGDRNASPQVVAAVLVKRAIETSAYKQLLPVGRIESIAPGQGRRADGMTMIQCGVLYLVATNRSDDGVCRLSAVSLSRLLAKSFASHVSNVLQNLEARGLIERVERERGSPVQPWRLTPEGEDLAEELAGDEE